MDEEVFYRDILDRITSGVYFVNQERVITYWNKGAERLSGYAAQEVVGFRCAEVLSHIDEFGRSLCGELCPLLDAMKDGAPRQAELFMLHKTGQRVPVLVQAMHMNGSGGTITGAVEIFNDISPLKLAQARIRELNDAANKDALTGVYNRRGLEILLREWFNDFQQYQVLFGVVFIDLDEFKQVNDKYGHAAGDQVLIGIGSALKKNLREADIVGRWGGDEFLLLLRDVTEKTIDRVIKKISKLTNSQTYELDGRRFSVKCSLGGVIPSHSEDLISLIKRADEAMYQHKKGASHPR